jgi:hypothetical protein
VYAAELRASAGLPPYVATDALPAADRFRRRLRASSLGTIAELPAVRAVRTFLPELRPAWWVVRGYLFAIIVDAMFFRANADGGLPWPSFGNGVSGTAFVIVCVVVSILAGRAATRDTRRRVLAILANVAIVLVFAAALPRYEIGSTTVTMVGAEPGPLGFLQHGDGAPITNVCAYDKDGKRLKDVQLFDQDGRPIVESSRGKLEFLMDKLKGDVSIRPRDVREIDPETGAIQQIECPKKLKDLQSKQMSVERGLIRKKLLRDDLPPEPFLPEKVRPFAGE